MNSKPFVQIALEQYNPSTIAALTSRRSYDGDCNYDCSKTRVLLNQSNAFTGATAEDPCDYCKFFITGNTTKSYGSTWWYSLTAVIMHEMGHILGFGDQSYGGGEVCGHDGSIMTNEDMDEKDRTLSEDDKCMYRKLYCVPSHTDVAENQQGESFVSLYPNPTNDQLTVSISPTGSTNYSIDLLSVDGSRILLIEDLFTDISKSVQKKIDTSNLPSGIYFIWVRSNNLTQALKLIIME